MNAHDMQAVIAAIKKHNSFTVSAHVNPEGDALGSAMGLASLLRRLGKKAIVANDGGIPKEYDYLPRCAPVLREKQKISVEAAIIVDVPTLERLGRMRPIIEKAPLVINIDHHVSNKRFGDINWVDPNAAAVGEMVFRLYRAFRIRPSLKEATCLYLSLVTDTGSFRYMNTTPFVHEIASELLAIGVSPLEISQHLYEAYSPSDLKFLGELLKQVRHVSNGRIAWLEVTRALVNKFKAGSEITDVLVNYPRSIKTAEVAFVLKEAREKGLIRISFRSKGRIDVNEIAKHFGGGGHKAASGCTIHGTLSDAREKVLRVVRHALQEK